MTIEPTQPRPLQAIVADFVPIASELYAHPDLPSDVYGALADLEQVCLNTAWSVTNGEDQYQQFRYRTFIAAALNVIAQTTSQTTEQGVAYV